MRQRHCGLLMLLSESDDCVVERRTLDHPKIPLWMNRSLVWEIWNRGCLVSGNLAIEIIIFFFFLSAWLTLFRVVPQTSSSGGRARGAERERQRPQATSKDKEARPKNQPIEWQIHHHKFLGPKTTVRSWGISWRSAARARAQARALVCFSPRKIGCYI